MMIRASSIDGHICHGLLLRSRPLLPETTVKVKLQLHIDFAIITDKFFKTTLQDYIIFATRNVILNIT